MEPFFHMNIEKNEKPEVTDQLSFTDQARRNKCATQSIISLKTVHFGVSSPSCHSGTLFHLKLAASDSSS